MKTESLISLWNITQRHPGTSGARVAAGVLLSLYNGPRFPFDLTELRLLGSKELQAALDVIASDAARCEKEVHSWLCHITGRHDFGQRFEHLAHEWRRKGRCKKEFLDPLEPQRLIVSAGE
jgi:hypothetical protein